MIKKQAEKKNNKTKAKRNIFLAFYSGIFIFCLFLGAILYYESRAIPEPGDEARVTVVPNEFRHILGTKTSPETQSQTPVKIPIFLYHYVEYVHNDPGRQNLNIPPNILTSQIETLKNAGYTFVTADELASALSGKIKLPEKVVMLTFDDGYMDLYTDVLPILKKEQVKAVAYIVPDFLNRPNYLFTYQLRELAKSQLVEIGAHTMDHAWLKGISGKTAYYQIEQSKKTLQDILHIPINSFAYPYGAFDRQAINIATTAGFSNAVSTIPGVSQSEQNKYFLYRLRPGYRSGQALLNFLKQDKFQPW